MNDKGYLEKALVRAEARRFEFMVLDWEDTNKADHDRFLDIGVKVFSEDDTINLYLLYNDEVARFKVWEFIGRTALHYDKKFPTQDRLEQFHNCLEEHFQNMVNKRLAEANTDRLNEIVKTFEVPDDKAEQFKRDMALLFVIE